MNAAFEARRLDELRDDKGLRRQQKIEQVRREFERHPDNPFNQVSARYNSTREEMAEIRGAERAKTEQRLATRAVAREVSRPVTRGRLGVQGLAEYPVNRGKL